MSQAAAAVVPRMLLPDLGLRMAACAVHACRLPGGPLNAVACPGQARDLPLCKAAACVLHVQPKKSCTACTCRGVHHDDLGAPCCRTTRQSSRTSWCW